MSHRNAAIALLTLLLTAGAAPARAEQRLLTLDREKTAVQFVLGATGHDVEGSFALASGEIRFDPADGAASGEIVVDLTGARTGSSGRDKEMHGKVLETAKYPQAVFRPTRLRGALASSGSSQVELVGTLGFHGADHPLTIPARVSVEGERLTGTADFAIPFVEWGLHDPSVFVLRVDKQVAVRLSLAGDLVAVP